MKQLNFIKTNIRMLMLKREETIIKEANNLYASLN